MIWECKNYAELEASDFHQMSYYMSESISNFVVCCFRGERKKHYFQHISKISKDKKGMILLLEERDMKVIIRKSLSGKSCDDHLNDIYDQTERMI